MLIRATPDSKVMMILDSHVSHRNQHGRKRTAQLSELITGSPLKKSLSDKHERLLLKEIAKENRKKKRSNKLEHVGEKSKKSKRVLTTNKQEEIAKRDKNNEFSEMTNESTLQRRSQNGLRMSR